MSDEKWILDRFAFAAQTIQNWTIQFGKEEAERMVRNSKEEYSTEALMAFNTAFGG